MGRQKTPKFPVSRQEQGNSTESRTGRDGPGYSPEWAGYLGASGLRPGGLAAGSRVNSAPWLRAGKSEIGWGSGWRCCQSNGNLSLVWRSEPKPSRTSGRKGALLSQCGRASFPVKVSADAVAFLIEVVVDGGVYGAEFLQGLHPPEARHRPLSSSEW